MSNQGYPSNPHTIESDISLGYNPINNYINSSGYSTYLNNEFFERENTINMLKEQLNKKNESIQRNQDKIYELKDRIKVLRSEKDKLEINENNKLKVNSFQNKTINSLQEQVKILINELSRKDKLI